MPTFDVSVAKTHLSRLLDQIERGATVVISRHGKPVAKLVPYRPRARRQFGALRGRVSIDERFFDPLPETELDLWDGRISKPSSTPDST